MKRILLTSAWVCLIHVMAFADYKDLDSLKAILDHQNDTNRILMLCRMAEISVREKPGDPPIYARKALQESRDIGYHKGMGLSQRQIGVQNEMSGQLDSALYYYEQSLHALQEGQVESELHYALIAVGRAYSNLGKEELSAEYYIRGLKKAEVRNDSDAVAEACIYLGKLYVDSKMYDKAEEKMKRALELDLALKHTSMAAYDYLMLGILYEDQHRNDEGIEVLNKALAIYNKLDMQMYAAYAGEYLGHCYANKGDVEACKKAMIEAIQVYEKTGLNSSLCVAYNNFGEVLIKVGQGKEGRGYCFKGADLALRNKYADPLMTSHELLWKSFEADGMYKEAFDHLKIEKHLRDSVGVTSRDEKIAEVEAKYKDEKKTQELALLAEKNKVQELKLTQSRNLMAGGAGLGVAAIGFLVFVYQNRRLRDRKQMLELQQKALRSQMNPHFIFNALTSIQGFIRKNQSDEATQFLGRFARLIRAILEGSREDKILLQQEVEMLDHYLALENLRMNGHLEYHIRVSSELDPEDEEMPTLILQPLIENSIKHGFQGTAEEEWKLDVEIARSEGSLVCTVTDNGIGRTKAQELKEATAGTHKSYGTRILQERIEAFNKRYKKPILMQTDDVFPQGTRVRVYIPFVHEPSNVSTTLAKAKEALMGS